MDFSLKYVTTDEDVDFLLDVHNDPLVLNNITNPNPIDQTHHLKWMSKIFDEQSKVKEARMIFCVDGKNAGVVKFYSIDQINGNCVLGADLHKDFRGKGYAKEMWKQMLNICFSEFGLNLHRVSLTTAHYNKPAIKVYSKLGFKLEGKFKQSLFRDGTYYDQLLFYMLKSTWDNRKNVKS